MRIGLNQNENADLPQLFKSTVPDTKKVTRTHTIDSDLDKRISLLAIQLSEEHNKRVTKNDIFEQALLKFVEANEAQK